MTRTIRMLGLATALTTSLAAGASAAGTTNDPSSTTVVTPGYATTVTPNEPATGQTASANNRYLPSNATAPQGTVVTGDGRVGPANVGSGGAGGSGGGNGR